MRTDSENASLHAAMVALMPRLRRFAYGLCGSTHDADDLVQAACARALERLDQWRGGTRLDSWMYRIVQSIHFNRHRAEKTRHDVLERLDVRDATADTADTAHGQVALERVRRCVWQLPEDQRACLLLVVVEGLSYQESAEVLGIPVGTLTSRLSRARGTLRELIEPAPEVTPVHAGGRTHA